VENGHLTCIYYTANRKKEPFAKEIRESLLEALGKTPLISVSQYPLEFGKNICVGDVGHTLANGWRQLQIGAMAATTPFVCAAEDDMLYPKEYFQFRPDREDTFYFADPCFHVFGQKRKIHFWSYNRRGAEGAIVVGRDHLIRQIGNLLDQFGTWSTRGQLHLFKGSREEKFSVPIPVVQFRVDEDMHRRCKHDNKNRLQTLEPFGECRQSMSKYRCEFR
jgi:hypothetical protein